MEERFHELNIARSRINTKIKKCICEVFNREDLVEILDILREKNRLANEEDIKREISDIYRYSYEVIGFKDYEYPRLLKQIEEAPVMLMFNGANEKKDILLRDCFSVVGSRDLGREDAKIIGDVIDVACSIESVIVSGLARGSDIIAHIKSLKSGTIAVMPCGLNKCYPAEHKYFMEKIIDCGGAIISDFPTNEPPRQANFINRNRIITGMSFATFIARAREIKSGSMSSANFAKKQGRKIYTYDFSGESAGNKYLIDNGIAEIVDDLNSFSLSLISDLAEMDMLIEGEEKSLEERNLQSFQSLFSNGDAENYEGNVGGDVIKNEILSITKHKNITISESNAVCVLEMCANILQVNKKLLLKAILEMI